MLAPIADIKILFFCCHACTVHTVKPGYVVAAGEGHDHMILTLDLILPPLQQDSQLPEILKESS